MIDDWIRTIDIDSYYNGLKRYTYGRHGGTKAKVYDSTERMLTWFSDNIKFLDAKYGY